MAMGRKTTMQLLLLMVIYYGAVVDALRFDVPSASNKCLSEEIQTNVLVLAVYHVVSEDNDKSKISVSVTSPYGNQLHSGENVPSGQFSFTTSETGNYMACFWLPSTLHGHTVSVELDWKIGVTAKDWETVAKKEKIEGVELELMKVQGAVEALHSNLLFFRQREQELREVSEVTNTRVAWFSISSLMICLIVTGWQIWHLKNYFERKKLL